MKSIYTVVILALFAGSLAAVLLNQNKPSYGESVESNDFVYSKFDPNAQGPEISQLELENAIKKDGKRGLAYLQRTISNESNPDAWRLQCFKALAEYQRSNKDKESADALFVCLDSDNCEIAEAAMLALTTVLRTHSSDIDMRERFTSALDGCSRSTRHPRIQCASFSALAELGISKFNHRINKILVNENASMSIKISAVNAASRLKDIRFEEPLRRIRNTSSTNLYQAANLALQQLSTVKEFDNETESRQGICALLKSDRIQIRHKAALALSTRQLSKEELPLLLEAIRKIDGLSEEREIAPYFILVSKSECKSSEWREVLSGLLDERSFIYQGRKKDSVHRLRSYLIFLMGQMQLANEIFPVIIDALVNSDDQMQLNRASAAYALSRVEKGGAVFVPFLVKVLQSEYGDQPLVLGSLDGVSNSAERTTARLEIIRTLGSMGSQAREALSSLEVILTTQFSGNTERYRLAASEAITKIRRGK